jgi:uncharacterized protein (DUF58 family)
MRALIGFFLTLVLFLMAQGTGNPVLFQFFYILAGSLVISYLWGWLNLRGLAAWRDLRSSRAQVGRQLEQHLLIENQSIWPKLWVEAEDYSDLPGHTARFATSIPPREHRRLRTRTICQLRGKYTVGPIVIRTGDPLGLFRFRKRIPSTGEVMVYPATEEIHGFHLPPAELPGGMASRQRTHHITPNVSGVREYSPGDSFNRIHWPSTAHQQRLIVKEFELDPSADVWIVLDMDRDIQRVDGIHGPPSPWPEQEIRKPESTEEYIVKAGASLAGHFILHQRRNTGLVAWGQQREIIPPEREPRQFYRFLESLAILRARGSTSLAEVLAAEANRFGRHTSLVTITSSTEPAWVRSGLIDLLYSGIHAVVVLVDPSSFGGWRDLTEIEAELIAYKVPYYTLKMGDPIGAKLSGPASMVEWQRGSRYVTEHYTV